MRHRRQTGRLGRPTGHRKAMVASLVCSLIEERRITTTLAKAKVARGLAERMVKLARLGTLAARRQAIAVLHQESRVGKLFSEIAPALAGRQGGYTRIVRVGARGSDGSEMALVEWVGAAVPATEAVAKPRTEAEEKPRASAPSTT